MPPPQPTNPQLHARITQEAGLSVTNVKIQPTRREQFDSDEEFNFLAWLHEAVKYGLVKDWDYQPRSFHLIDSQTFVEFKQLKTKVKRVERSLHQETTYTPDFVFELTDKGYTALLPVFKKALLGSEYEENCVWIDVKGTFSRNDDGRHLSLLQKLLYEKHGIWVQKVVVPNGGAGRVRHIFLDTWIPENQRWMSKRRKPTLNKLGEQCQTIEEFIEKSLPKQDNQGELL